MRGRERESEGKLGYSHEKENCRRGEKELQEKESRPRESHRRQRAVEHGLWLAKLLTIKPRRDPPSKSPCRKAIDNGDKSLSCINSHHEFGRNPREPPAWLFLRSTGCTVGHLSLPGLTHRMFSRHIQEHSNICMQTSMLQSFFFFFSQNF